MGYAPYDCGAHSGKMASAPYVLGLDSGVCRICIRESQWESQIGCNFERMFAVQFRPHITCGQLSANAECQFSDYVR